MATFVLVPGAGGVAWYWHLVAPLLEAAGHEVIAVDLPGDDERAGLDVYATRVVSALERAGARDVVLVAQSLAGFTAPLVCARVPVARVVLVNAMIPLPDETAGDWWHDTRAIEARQTAARRAGYSVAFDVGTYFLHDLPPELALESEQHQRRQAERIFTEPCAFTRWPAVPIRVIAGRDDRFFPIDFQRRVALERLRLHVDDLPGGHLLALANPRGLVDKLV
jgi:pimeloyl-ACP methyl ester carboxylesterase